MVRAIVPVRTVTNIYDAVIDDEPRPSQLPLAVEINAIRVWRGGFVCVTRSENEGILHGARIGVRPIDVSGVGAVEVDRSNEKIAGHDVGVRRGVSIGDVEHVD